MSKMFYHLRTFRIICMLVNVVIWNAEGMFDRAAMNKSSPMFAHRRTPFTVIVS